MENLNDIAVKQDGKGGLSLFQLENMLSDIQFQPEWRSEADTCDDFYDGHQITQERLQRMEKLGIPPLVTNLIAPVINSVLGQEAKARTDWRVTEADEADQVPEEMMLALNAKLNEIERESRADRAISDAYASMIKTGVGWVEVSRSTDCFAYPYRVSSVHRNEMWWDWRAKQPDLSDARYVVRKRRFDVDELTTMMPEKKDLIEAAVFDRFNTWQYNLSSQIENTPDLAYAAHLQRVTNIDSVEWRDMDRRRATIFECWYRQWVRGKVLELPNGSLIKFNPRDEKHAMAVGQGFIQPQTRVYSDIRVAFFLGCHRLYDMPTPYNHRFFPYVPFFGYKEGLSGIRYGLIRGMISPQDVVNSADAKMHWLLNGRRLTASSDAIDTRFNTWRQVQEQLSSPNAVVLLDPTKPNAKFNIDDQFDLNAQQFQRRQQASTDIENAAGIYKASMGKESQGPQSGIAVNSLIEQTGVMMAEINDNAAFARRQVGEMTFSLMLEDMGKRELPVAIKKHGKKKVVTLNQKVFDEQTGQEAVENDVSTVRTKVTLSDIPTTASFKAQQLAILSEVAKSMPPEMQAVFVPAMLLLSDAPDKEDLADEIRKMAGIKPKMDDDEQAIADQQAEEAEKVAEALQQRTAEAQVKLLESKVDQLIKLNSKTDAEIEKIGVDNVLNRIESSYSAIMAAVQALTNAQVAPIADQIMKSAGAIDQDTPPIIAAPLQGAGQPVIDQAPGVGVTENTSPMFPPKVQEPDIEGQAQPAMEGIGPGPDAGMNEGIEAGG